jgi:hypothetical protein
MPDADNLAATLGEIRNLVGERDELVARMRVAAVGVEEFNAAQDRLAERVPRLLALADAVLALTRDGSGDDLYPTSDLTVGDLRDAISKALLGEDADHA